jgi:hypothetical protein
MIDSLRGRVRMIHPYGRARAVSVLGAPIGPTFAREMGEAGRAILVVPTSIDDPAALAAMLPDPEQTGGAIVILPGEVPQGLAARIFGRVQRVPRAVRGAALLLRGYRAIAGGVDPASGIDLCWGEA